MKKPENYWRSQCRNPQKNRKGELNLHEYYIPGIQHLLDTLRAPPTTGVMEYHCEVITLSYLILAHYSGSLHDQSLHMPIGLKQITTLGSGFFINLVDMPESIMNSYYCIIRVYCNCPDTS